jgi:ABC-2 type transport system permease protein
MWAIMGCVTSFSISIVTERVAGTFLRLRIAPLSWSQLLVGKGLACFLACSGVAVILLIVGHFLFGVRLGNPLLLALAILCTSACFVGIMMLLATLGKTEQGVAGAGWGILMPLAMLGGGMIPLIFMPAWMQSASSISPIKWGIIGLEGAVWRGFDLSEMLLPCAILLAIGATCFFLGIKNLARIEKK